MTQCRPSARRTAGKARRTSDSDEAGPIITTGLGGDHFHWTTGDPGTGDHPAGALRQGLAVQSRGANGAERSEFALDGTCEPWLGPWYPVMPVEPVPSLSGGDTPAALSATVRARQFQSS